MRILLINWARIVDGAQVGGGVNGYCQGIALELAQRGHRVTYLSSGVTYSRSLDEDQPPTVRQLDDFRATDAGPPIRVYDMVDSPVVAPAIFQFNRPDLEATSASLERAFATFLEVHGFDVVHFHNIEGLSAGCIEVALDASSCPRVVFSLHNYHTVCPQVYLMQAIADSQLRAPCRDYRNGHACIECERTHDPATEVARRIGVREPASESSRHGPRRAQETPVDLTLDNSIVREPVSDLEPGAYARRRAAMIAALSRCHAVLAVSSFVRRKFESMGVDPSVLREMPIGTRMIRLARDFRAQTCPRPNARFSESPNRPIRLAFLGYHNYYKGLHVLVEALELLDVSAASRIELHVYAKDVAPIRPRLEGLSGSLAAVCIENGYEYGRVPAILCDKDLLVVPSVWWDNGPQTVMEAIACGLPLLASAIGGIPDLVADGANALLFRAGDARALAARIREVANEPTIIDRLRDRLMADPPALASMDQHAIEIDLLYSELLAARAASIQHVTA